MAIPQPKAIKLISECFVKPKKEVEAAKQPYYLGPVDLVFLFSDPIQNGLLFPFSNDPTQPELGPIMERLKLALSMALVHFYPLAGRFETIQYEGEHACSVYLDCTKGPGARLIHATMDVTASNILSSTDVHPAVRSFFELGERIPNLEGLTKALLTIQVTELLDGVFIGFSMNHSVVDGTSFVHFVSMLSEIFRSHDIMGEKYSTKISRAPHYKMHILEGSDPIIKMAMLSHELDKYVIQRDLDPNVLRERIFHFSPESIAILKAKANEECGSGDTISSFMALSGLVWRSMTRAHNLGTDEETSCHFSLNARTRLDPTLSEDYFGNFLGNVRAVCKVDELLGQSMGQTSRFLTQEIKKVNHEAICRTLKMFGYFFTLGPTEAGKAQERRAPNLMNMGGSHRFDIYEHEFGLGRAAAVLMGYGNKSNGKVVANPGCEGRGSVDLEICLRPHIMSALESDEEFMSYVTFG